MAAPDSFGPLRTFILAHTSLPEVILGFGPGNRPSLPYGTLHLTSARRVNRPEQRILYSDAPAGVSSAAREEPGIEWELVWQFDVFGDGAEDVFTALDTARFVPTARQALLPYSISEVSGIRFLPEIIDNAYEDRANVDITLRAVIHHDTAIDLIETNTDPVITPTYGS